MFRRVRLRLTLLYLGVAVTLIAVISGGTYGLIDALFQSATDLALQRKMIEQFLSLGAPLPATLASIGATAEGKGWSGVQWWSVLSDRSTAVASDGEEEPPDTALLPLYVLVLDAQGQLVFDPNSTAAPFAPDRRAAGAALAHDYDWRTVRVSSGHRLRLLTYRLTRFDGPAIIQIGRLLADQDRLRSELIALLIGLGLVSTAVLGLGSWWLAGRTLRPVQRAWEAQQDFVANASHELRTPLTLVRASSEVMADQLAPDAPQSPLLQDILLECDHMQRLIADLLLLSRLDAGQLVITLQPVSMASLLPALQRQVGRIASERGVQLALAEASGVALADPLRLRQVLLILLDNALRHTPAGGSVRLAARPVGGHLAIEVQDSGAGIPGAALDRVFERFYRASAARGTDHEGTGLGLAIARGLMTAQHGQLTLASRLGQGTIATVRLPRGSAARRTMSSARLHSLRHDDPMPRLAK